MRFKLLIDRTRDEEVVATVHERSATIDKIEMLVLQHGGSDKIPVYLDDGMRMLGFAQIECVMVLDGKTYAVDTHGEKHLVKLRLYELEERLPSCFVRINKSVIANENRLEKFSATYSGAVNAVFKCGYTEYVSRRCFAAIKRRYEVK